MLAFIEEDNLCHPSAFMEAKVTIQFITWRTRLFVILYYYKLIPIILGFLKAVTVTLYEIE